MPLRCCLSHLKEMKVSSRETKQNSKNERKRKTGEQFSNGKCSKKLRLSNKVENKENTDPIILQGGASTSTPLDQDKTLFEISLF